MKTVRSKNIKASFKDIMIAKILSGELKPGDKLLPERQLSEELHISRGSINQGILDLERMGFLRVAPRHGTYVAEYIKNSTPDTLATIMNYDSTFIDKSLFHDLMEFRILIERKSVRLACDNLNDENISLLNESTKAIYDAKKEDLSSAIYQYHKCITVISGNVAYAMVFESFKTMIENMIRLHLSNEMERQISLPKFQELTDAIINRNYDEADGCMHTLLLNASKYLNENL